MRESKLELEKRTQTIIQKLKRYYPDAHCALEHESPFQLLIATVLSAQCTDERVNSVTRILFRDYPTAETLAAASVDAIEDIVRPTGFFRMKAKNIKSTAQHLMTLYKGDLPRTIEQLTSLPGVGRKTANVVLGNAYGLATGIVVDTHVKRLAFRLGLTKQKSPEKVEEDLLKIVPMSDWIWISHGLIFHGRSLCKARKPSCERCPLEGDCRQKGVASPR